MFRMTLALSLALYGGLVVWGEPVPQATAGTTPTATDEAVAAALAPAGPAYAQPVILPDAAAPGPQVARAAVSSVIVPDAATIAAAAVPEVRPIGEPILVSLMRDAPADAVGLAAVMEDEPTPETLFRVAGDRVNMRSGPSTTNAVVASLPGGTLAEAIGAEGGWMRIRVLDTGAEGFMSARFLEPA